MIWHLYLDDIRNPPDDKEYVVCRGFLEAAYMVREKGCPTSIAFDHDLGISELGGVMPSGMDFAKWLTRQAMMGELEFPENFRFTVHSANPVGRGNIIAHMDSYFRSLE